LVPLAAPDLGSSRYSTAHTGYDQYVRDYKLYRTTLAEIEEQSLLAKVQRANTRVDVVGRVALLSFGTLSDQALDQTFPVSDLQGRRVMSSSGFVMLASAAVPLFEAVVPGDVDSFDAVVPTSGGPQTFVLRNVRTRQAAPVAARVPKPIKAKGPAVTAPKQRTAEEAAERAARSLERKSFSDFARKAKTNLAMANIEEKLAVSVAKRAALVTKADRSVDTTVDLADWRLVTHKRKQRKFTVDVKKSDNGGKTTEKFVSFS
jgi:hypothetical protein